MPTNTYVALDKKTIVGSSTTSITFTSIPSTYTDLELVINARSVGSSDYAARISFNGDTSSGLYSWALIRGNGTAASSLSYSGQNDIAMTTNYSIMQTPSTIKVSLQNYSNSSINKTIAGRFSQTNPAGVTASAFVGLWRNTNAITSITVTIGGDYFADGSTFSLYGIRAEGVSPTTKATGGAVYSDSTYYYHVFGASGTFTPTQSITADVLVVAGGGGGGDTAGGGGGAGGLLGFSSQSLTATGYTVTVGAGGTAGSGYNGSGKGGVGGDSQFGSLTLVKGGGGGGDYTNVGGGGLGGTGLTGGSGGGGGVGTTSGGAGGAATSGQGNAGGAGAIVGSNYPAGGGGGAGAVGTAAASNVAGNGGVGLSTYSSWGVATGTGENISGTYYYAGGGGGAQSTNRALGGYGGGGLGGSNSPAIAGAAGLPFTGGGGGGGRDNLAGKGGSGIVIVRYAK